MLYLELLIKVTQFKTSKPETIRDIDVAVILSGLTPLVQPVDVSINRPFKQQMRHLWEHWMIYGEPSLTNAGRHGRKEILVQWLVKVWDLIPSAMIKHSFKKCGILNNLDGKDDRHHVRRCLPCARGHGQRC